MYIVAAAFNKTVSYGFEYVGFEPTLELEPVNWDTDPYKTTGTTSYARSHLYHSPTLWLVLGRTAPGTGLYIALFGFEYVPGTDG